MGPDDFYETVTFGRRAYVTLITVTVVIVAGCTQSPSQTGPIPSPAPRSSSVWPHQSQKALLMSRALRHPPKRTGCPVTASQVVAPEYGPAQGTGPVYPVTDGSIPVTFPAPARSVWAGSRFSGEKVRWIARPGYAGPVLIRGFSVSGDSGPVRFNTGLKSLLFTAKTTHAGSGWHEYSQWHYVRLRHPGCYAWQIDGNGFSKVIIFRVTRSP